MFKYFYYLNIRIYKFIYMNNLPIELQNKIFDFTNYKCHTCFIF